MHILEVPEEENKKNEVGKNTWRDSSFYSKTAKNCDREILNTPRRQGRDGVEGNRGHKRDTTFKGAATELTADLTAKAIEDRDRWNESIEKVSFGNEAQWRMTASSYWGRTRGTVPLSYIPSSF